MRNLRKLIISFLLLGLGISHAGDSMVEGLPTLKALMEFTEGKALPASMTSDASQLMGQLEGIMIMMQIAEQHHPGSYDVKGDYTTAQLIRIVYKYAQDHPQLLQMRQRLFLAKALVEQYSNEAM